MSLEIKGTVFKILPMQTGQKNAGGIWQKQDFVIETGGKYPQKVCFTTWGDKTDEVSKLGEGQGVTVSFEPSSREYHERWYTELKAWKIVTDTATQPATQPAAPTVEEISEDDGNLPF